MFPILEHGSGQVRTRSPHSYCLLPSVKTLTRSSTGPKNRETRTQIKGNVLYPSIHPIVGTPSSPDHGNTRRRSDPIILEIRYFTRVLIDDPRRGYGSSNFETNRTNWPRPTTRQTIRVCFPQKNTQRPLRHSAQFKMLNTGKQVRNDQPGQARVYLACQNFFLDHGL
ncbi:hypothetical protein B9Z19DRAFT_149092 [Tuber borchii]|uniref:Uncharacterized protein n=1 Tax=Tuber borchii TaxID=42251 RepID=A0A2T6ZQ30_TUBBO|nr:hypothetical protein B9Z19DRAFT_149092 [Tuber borchii]